MAKGGGWGLAGGRGLRCSSEGEVSLEKESCLVLSSSSKATREQIAILVLGGSQQGPP